MRKIGKMAKNDKIGGQCGHFFRPPKLVKMGVFSLFLGVFSLFLGVLRNVEDAVAFFIV